MVVELDDTDRGIIHALQKDARDATTNEIASTVGVSASTVRNRVERLEQSGVIRGYYPEVDYERAGYPLHGLVECHAPPGRRSELARQVLDLHGVTRVRELLTGNTNLHVETVAADSDAVDELIEGLTDLGLEIVNADIIKGDSVQPFNHFGKDIVDE